MLAKTHELEEVVEGINREGFALSSDYNSHVISVRDREEEQHLQQPVSVGQMMLDLEKGTVFPNSEPSQTRAILKESRTSVNSIPEVGEYYGDDRGSKGKLPSVVHRTRFSLTNMELAEETETGLGIKGAAAGGDVTYGADSGSVLPLIIDYHLGDEWDQNDIPLDTGSCVESLGSSSLKASYIQAMAAAKGSVFLDGGARGREYDCSPGLASDATSEVSSNKSKYLVDADQSNNTGSGRKRAPPAPIRNNKSSMGQSLSPPPSPSSAGKTPKKSKRKTSTGSVDNASTVTSPPQSPKAADARSIFKDPRSDRVRQVAMLRKTKRKEAPKAPGQVQGSASTRTSASSAYPASISSYRHPKDCDKQSKDNGASAMAVETINSGEQVSPQSKLTVPNGQASLLVPSAHNAVSAEDRYDGNSTGLSEELQEEDFYGVDHAVNAQKPISAVQQTLKTTLTGKIKGTSTIAREDEEAHQINENYDAGLY